MVKYKKLKKGTIVNAGDEFYVPELKKWYKSVNWVSQTFRVGDCKSRLEYRRKVS